MKCSSYKAAISVLFAAVLTACGGGGGGGTGDSGYVAAASKPLTDAKPDGGAGPVPVVGCTVELYGDSIMAGNGTSETPAMTLQRLRPGLQVVADHAVPGTTLLVQMQGFADSPRTARYVVIENGVIDSWQGYSIDLMLASYSVMIEQLRSEGRVPVLTGFSHQSVGGTVSADNILRRDAYYGIIKNFAGQMGVAFADWGSVPFNGPSDLLDFVHPNKVYSDRLVEQLASTLDQVAPECVK
ncbi:SGNH/GDSL hydrolase family protein [Variovorax sp. J2P1-59]|uniref:SGNH/GDSL hydrolase family protein n=1 Tax=Variovorax flavidus TaxID=3053501 RepID=UPI002576F3C4|nr:SGNH/GDSL hydrolase family protein [Variovorax sp. J2P1-59]MDM0078253.1 SGNH/GDSL hydrolase family protein [Variovorax sp. J2P1-59]